MNELNTFIQTPGLAERFCLGIIAVGLIALAAISYRQRKRAQRVAEEISKLECNWYEGPDGEIWERATAEDKGHFCLAVARLKEFPREQIVAIILVGLENKYVVGIGHERTATAFADEVVACLATKHELRTVSYVLNERVGERNPSMVTT